MPILCYRDLIRVMVAEPCIQLAEDADAVDQTFRDLAVIAKHQAAKLIQRGNRQPVRMGGVVAQLTGAGKIMVGLIPPSGALRIVCLAVFLLFSSKSTGALQARQVCVTRSAVRFVL